MSKMTPLEVQVDDVRHDQYVVEDTLKRFDFELASKLVAICVEQRALAEQQPPSKPWKPTAEEMRTTAAKMVLDVLKLGREHGPNVSISGSFMSALYKHTGEDAAVMEVVELELSVIRSWGIRPLAKYLADIRAYIGAMGGGWLDEDGRWQPGEPPTYGKPHEASS